MPDPNTFDETLGTLAEYIKDIGDELQEESEPNILDVTIRGQEYSLTGHRCVQGDNRYIVAGHPDLRSVSIVYLLSVQANLAADLDLEIAEAIVDEEYEEEEEMLQDAAERLLNQVPRGQMEAFESYCYQFISGEAHETSFITNEEESFIFFAVSNEIFPYEDSFEISDFYKALKPVVSAGERGSRLIGRTVYLDIDEESPGSTEIELNFNW